MNTGIPPAQTLPLTSTKLAVSPGFLKDLPFPFRRPSSYPRENSYFPYLEKNCNYSTVRPHNRKMTSASVLRKFIENKEYGPLQPEWSDSCTLTQDTACRFICCGASSLLCWRIFSSRLTLSPNK